MKQKPLKHRVANAFGALGYFFCFLQWFWAVMLYLSVIQSATLFISSTADQPVEQTPPTALALPGWAEAIVVGIVIVIMLALTVYALIKIPASIAKTGSKVLRKTTTTVTPLVIKVQHQPNTKKTRAKITARLILAIKLLLVIIPLSATALSGLLEKQSIDYAIAIVLGCVLASGGVLFFSIQYALARLLRIKLSAIW
jgi:hypothetical protein